jgi:putative membrane protein
MKRLVSAERFLLIGHILSMAFGLAGILLVLPNPQFIAQLPEFGQVALRWSLAGGGVAYMILGTAAVGLYAYRTLGVWHWLGFMIPAVFLSLGSELLGTSTGFPFGHYHYLSGLGYKIAGLVPFTIPLSWFYLGLSAYLLARAGLASRQMPNGLLLSSAIALASLLLTSWDFVLDPAMSQSSLAFWAWEQPGAFFGMPYQNFAGWFGTGTVFMTVATLLWKLKPVTLQRTQLALPLAIYLSNFAFAAIISLAAGLDIPVVLGILSGVAPALALYWMANSSQAKEISPEVSEVETAIVPVTSLTKVR